MGAFCALVLPMWTMLSPWSKQSHGCSCQGCKAANHTGTRRNLPNPASGTPPTRAGTLRNPPEPSEPCLRNLHQHAPELSRTLRNLPRPSGTNLSEPSGTYLLNLRQHTPEPPKSSGTCLRKLHHFTPELSGTFQNCLRNLHQHTPEFSGTFRNLPPELAPATRTGTHRSLSGLKTPLAYAVGEKINIYIYMYI